MDYGDKMTLELWNEALSDTPNVPYETPAVRNRRLQIIHNELWEKFGIKVGNEADNATR